MDRGTVAAADLPSGSSGPLWTRLADGSPASGDMLEAARLSIFVMVVTGNVPIAATAASGICEQWRNQPPARCFDEVERQLVVGHRTAIGIHDIANGQSRAATQQSRTISEAMRGEASEGGEDNRIDRQYGCCVEVPRFDLAHSNVTNVIATIRGGHYCQGIRQTADMYVADRSRCHLNGLWATVLLQQAAKHPSRHGRSANSPVGDENNTALR